MLKLGVLGFITCLFILTKQNYINTLLQKKICSLKWLGQEIYWEQLQAFLHI